MFPAQDQNYVSEGLALLTDHYRSKIVIPALIAVYLRRIQELETIFYQIINGQLLANGPTGDQLTKLARLVGLQRDTGNDTQLLAEVKLTIRTLISQGGSNDVIAVAGIAAQGTGSPIVYYETPVASFGVEVLNLLSGVVSAPQSLAHFIFRAKSVGTRGVLVYTTWPSGNDLEWCSSTNAASGGGTYGSSTNTITGSLIASAAKVI